ncbi:MAG: WD40 repeat domain-containing protein [Candidatus Brocadiia bacterium]
MRRTLLLALFLSLELAACYAETQGPRMLSSAQQALTNALTSDTPEAWDDAIRLCRQAVADITDSTERQEAAQLLCQSLGYSLRPRDLGEFINSVSMATGGSSCQLKCWMESCSISSDNSRLAVIYPTGEVDIIATAKMQRLWTLNGNWDICRNVLFSPDGTRAVLDCAAVEVPMFDLRSGELIRTFPAGAQANAVAMSVDWKKIAISSSPGKTEYLVYETESGRLLMRATSDDYINRALLLPASSDNLVTFGSDEKVYYDVRVFSIADGREIARPIGGTGYQSCKYIFRLYEFPVSKSIAAFGDGMIFGLDLSTFAVRETCLGKIPDYVTADQGKEQIAFTAREGIFIWKPGMKKPKATLESEKYDFAIATGDATTIAIVRKGRAFFRGPGDITGFREARSPEAPVSDIVLSPSGKTLYIIDEDKRISRVPVGWSPDSKVVSQYLDRHPALRKTVGELHSEVITSLEGNGNLTPDVQQTMLCWLKRAADDGNYLEMLLAADVVQACSSTFGPDESSVRAAAVGVRRTHALKIGGGFVRDLFYSGKSHSLTAVCADNTISSIDLSTGKETFREKLPSPALFASDRSGGNFIVVVCSDGTVATYNADVHKRIGLHKLPTAPVQVAVAPLGYRGAAVGVDGELLIFDSSRCIEHVRLPEPELKKALLTPAAGRLITLFKSGKVALWGFQDDKVKLLGEFAPESPVEDIAFVNSSNNACAIALCTDGSVIVPDWEKDRLALVGHVPLAFTPTAIHENYMEDSPAVTSDDSASIPSVVGTTIRTSLKLTKGENPLCPIRNMRQLVRSKDGTVKYICWNPVTGEAATLRQFSTEATPMSALLLPESNALVLGHADGTISFWAATSR